MEFTREQRARIRKVASSTQSETATTPAWRRLMATTRKAKRITQTKLADLVGMSQANVSEIETGALQASKAIPAICMALRIPPPFLEVEHELDERWMAIGRTLRKNLPDAYEAQLAALEAIAKSTPDSD